MERASKLTNALREEQLAWTQHVTDLQQQLDAIAGNMLLRYSFFFAPAAPAALRFFFFSRSSSPLSLETCCSGVLNSTCFTRTKDQILRHTCAQAP
jgi:hypothetical protein